MARNAGIETAQGDIIVLTDSDNVLMPDTLQRIEAFFSANSHISALTGLISKEHPNKDFFSQYKNLYMNYVFNKLPERVTFLHGSICAIRRNFVPFGDPQIKTDDAERGQKLYNSGKEIAFLNTLEVIHLKKYNFLSLFRNDFLVPFD